MTTRPVDVQRTTKKTTRKRKSKERTKEEQHLHLQSRPIELQEEWGRVGGWVEGNDLTHYWIIFTCIRKSRHRLFHWNKYRLLQFHHIRKRIPKPTVDRAKWIKCASQNLTVTPLHPPYPDILEKGQLRLQGKRILICVKSLSAKMNEDAMLSAHGHLYWPGWPVVSHRSLRLWRY